MMWWYRERALASADAIRKVVVEHVAMLLGSDHHREQSVGRVRFVREHEIRPDGWDVQHLHEQEVADMLLSVDHDRPWLWLEIRQHLAECLDGVLRLHRRGALTCFLLQRLCRGNPCRDQTGADRFEEDALAPLTAREAHVERLRLSVRPRFDDR